MGRNWSRGDYGLRLAPVLQWVVALGVVAAVGLNYVWLKNQILRVSTEIVGLEKELDACRRRNVRLEAGIGTLLAPSELDRKVREWRLGLVPLGELEVVSMDLHGDQPAGKRKQGGR
jgi:hypothetical protein